MTRVKTFQQAPMRLCRVTTQSLSELLLRCPIDLEWQILS